ncbi:putative ankyrin repeat protein [Penicillium rolfsii]|nr:putative ankyrin repeat protein [Penicillium rolfsii]
MTILNLSNELILLIGRQLSSQKDLHALMKVYHRFHPLFKHLLYRYNLDHQSGDGVLQAAKLGSISAVAQFIKEGYLVRDRPIHEEHPPEPEFPRSVPCSCRLLHPILHAAEHGHSELVKYLLDSGSEPDFENNLGETPMHLAAKKGFLSVIKVLLDGSESRFPMDNDTKFTLAPIKEAALNGHSQVVEYFLSRVPSPRAYASSSLPLAAVSGDTALASMLLGKGADINFNYIERHEHREAPNPHGGRGHESTALSVASRYRHSALVEFLLANGCDVNLKTGYPYLRTSPLHLALEQGHNEVIKALLTHGSDVNDEDLREAILQHNKKGLKMLLVKHGTDKCHINLLEIAAEVGDTEILEGLLDQGFDQEQALLKAIEYGQEEIVSLLLAQGTDPDIPSLRECAIEKAIVHRHISILEMLLHHGAKIYPEVLRSAKLFAPENIATLAEQFPMHPISKPLTALYNAWEHGWRARDNDFGSTRRRLW